MALLAMLLTLAGLLMLLRPATIWMVAEQWKSYDATEPSDLYIWSTRIGGAICIVVELVYLFVLLG